MRKKRRRRSKSNRIMRFSILCFLIVLGVYFGQSDIIRNITGNITNYIIEETPLLAEKKESKIKEKNVGKSEQETAEAEKEQKFEQETAQNLQNADISDEEYVFGTLDGETKIVYREVLSAILNQEEKTSVSTLEIKTLEQAYKAVCADYGGLFWVSGYSYTQFTRGGKAVGLEFSPKYTMTKEEREETQKQIDASAEELLSGISTDASDYEKAKYIFEILIQNVDYDASADNNQNIISAFLSRATVCQGYACATQYLFEKLGLKGAIVTGTANGEAHAWNLVRLDGEYYYMDTTWGNSRYTGESQTEQYINYNYLAVTSEEIKRTHTIDDSFPLPECVSIQNNYFVREGRYFDKWEAEKIGAVLEQSFREKQEASVKFSSLELYRQAVSYFIDEQHFADYCSGVSSVYYLEDEKQYVLTIRF